MLAGVCWSRVLEKSDELWERSGVLYAYVARDNREILYIGKSDGTTVRQRWTRSAKEGFWDDLERQRAIFKHAVIVGEIGLEEGDRLTRELLADIESLLIKRILPWGNIQSCHSRISRPGLRVICGGDWPINKSEFRDL